VVQGRRLAALHATWRSGMTGYRDPMRGAKIEGQRYAACLAALTSENLVVVRKDKPETLERGGYVSVFTFKDLVVEKSAAASLTLVARPADPK
jgi:hypothetical protein